MSFLLFGSIGSLQLVWILLVAELIIYGIYVVVYRLTRDPLAKFPGPFLWKISIWPMVWQCARGKRHLDLLKAHRKYGPVVRVAPDMLSFDTGSSARVIYGPRHANLVKSDFHLTLDATISTPSVFAMVDKEKHAFRRRVILQAFTENAMQKSGEFYLHYTGILRDQLKEKTKNGWTKVNMGEYATWWGADVMGALALGRSFNCLRDPTYRNGIPMMRNAARFTYWAGHLPFRKAADYILAHPILSRIGGKAAIDNQNYFDYCENAMQARISEQEEANAAGKGEEMRKDYIHYLLNAIDPETGKGLTRNELKSDASVILAAGSDAIANAFASVMFYLCRNQRPRELAAAEVRKCFSTAEEIQVGPKMNSCTYLTACIDEAMRMAPVSPSPLERVATDEGIEIDGHHIPAGVTVGTFFYGMNLSDKIYRDPYKYWPERWLVDEKGINGLPLKEVNNAKQSFFPFSDGHRQCIAKILATRNLKLVVATMLWHFDFRATDKLNADEPSGEGEEKGVFGLEDAMISITQGPVLEMVDRFNIKRDS
ncbi:cytochrome P450 [Lepidopterella palustris CBS 459.81]|uniref:Cytochrome P450 n=1 Tax=Lepidopterella palustris CBS 459.81 TaxID=1314670 RepID=A0A8E2JCL6_9PEZI|nr:cytochrome P450 [Lepidopterella palustris CBS 459.81]